MTQIYSEKGEAIPVTAVVVRGNVVTQVRTKDVDGYEAADPSYMAVGAAVRYWKKYHPTTLTSQK